MLRKCGVLEIQSAEWTRVFYHTKSWGEISPTSLSTYPTSPLITAIHVRISLPFPFIIIIIIIIFALNIVKQ